MVGGSQGYRVKLADGRLRPRRLRRRRCAQARADDLNALFADPEVDVVQALQGGFGSAQAIPHLDFDLIAANPKPFVGYSDITALHVAIRQRAGVATVYGNGLVGRRRPARRRRSRRDRLLDVLTRRRRPARCLTIRTTPTCARCTAGSVTAPLVGGCLWLLMQTMGTPWEIELDGAILFFEDVQAPPYYVDGHLTQLAARRQARAAWPVSSSGEMKECD